MAPPSDQRSSFSRRNAAQAIADTLSGLSPRARAREYVSLGNRITSISPSSFLTPLKPTAPLFPPLTITKDHEYVLSLFSESLAP